MKECHPRHCVLREPVAESSPGSFASQRRTCHPFQAQHAGVMPHTKCETTHTLGLRILATVMRGSPMRGNLPAKALRAGGAAPASFPPALGLGLAAYHRTAAGA